MTNQRFRELVKRLHPDTSGDGRTITAFRRVIEASRLRKKRFSKCFCGVTILSKSKHCRAHSAVKVAGSIALCLSLMAAAGGTLPPMPPMPPVKKKVQRLSSPRGQELYSATPMAIVLPPRLFQLHWSYRLPLPRSGVMFTVERQRDFQSPWVKIGQTSAPPFAITTELPKAFYRVYSYRP